MDLKDVVREKYAEAARRAGRVEGDCCSSACCGPSAERLDDPITSRLYTDGQVSELPQEAVQASLGCGNPTALTALHPGEVVLDLGSGGGIDVLLSARRVGPTGKAYGLDMTEEMLGLARDNQRRAGLENVEFLQGEIEHIPLPDDSVDVVISNCVINLSPDKARVFAEAFRVLRPGGRFAVSDVVVRGDVPQEIRRNMELWVGCVAGALEEADYHAKLARAGFERIEIEPTRIYDVEDARQFLAGHGLDVDAVAPLARDKFMSAFIRARKPAAGHRGSTMGEPAATLLQDRVRAAVLRRLLRGERLDLTALAAEADLDLRDAAGALETLNSSGAIYMAGGAVTAAYPLSAVPTPHRVRLDGTTVYACCAIDALAVPAMQRGAGTVESRCAYCDAEIAVQVRDDRVIASRPEQAIVFHVGRDCCEAGPAVLTRCPHINFFCGPDHLSRWRSERPSLAGDTLALVQAVERAHEIFRPTIELVRGAATQDG